MTSFGSDLYTTNLHSSGTIYWKDFSPPLTGGGGGDIPTLAAVLEVGNDANNQSLDNVGSIHVEKQDGVLGATGNATGIQTLGCQDITTTEITTLDATVGDDLALGTAGASGGTITFNASAGTQATSITGSSPTNPTLCYNLDLTDTSNTFPSLSTADTLALVVARGNSMPAATVLDMNNNSITNATTGTFSSFVNAQHMRVQSENTSATPVGSTFTMNATAPANIAILSLQSPGGRGHLIFPTTIVGDNSYQSDGVTRTLTRCTFLDLSDSSNNIPGLTGHSTLAQVLSAGNTAGTNPIDMSTQNITNFTNLEGIGEISVPLFKAVIPATVTGQEAEFRCIASTGNTGSVSFIGIGGTSAADTFIKGDITVDSEGFDKLTKCTHLDLTDTSNVLQAAATNTLTDVLNYGNSAGTHDINLNFQDIQNGKQIGSYKIKAESNGLPGAAAIAGQVLIKNQNGATTSTLTFEGVTGNSVADTEIIGDSTLNSETPATVKYTKCTYLDLTDPSNQFTASAQEEYEWGAVWEEPRMAFPPATDFPGNVYPGSF